MRGAPLVEIVPALPDAVERRIAEFVAERITDGAVIQAGIESIPNSVLALLHDRKNQRHHRG